MQKRSAAALIRCAALRRCITRGLSLLLCLIWVIPMISASSVAHAGFFDGSSGTWRDIISTWIDNSSSSTDTNTWNTVDNSDHSYTVNNAQNYYTSVTNSVVDKSGNVTNYYRSGDTTNTKIIDSYNKTFNTIYNTNNTSTTNNYQANVKLDNFLNQYTTNNVTNNNTYSASYKSWYYDNTTNNYNYTQNNDYSYYNYDNSRYYISIDNSTDEYYLIDVQYSPTFVTVNYTYNTTNNNYNEKVGDVTNIYYFELKDGRNSSTLTAAEVAGLDFGYDVANYELVTDDPNTLSLQHYDSDYTDSSSYNRTFYSQNRSTTYVDSGAFGKAVSLPNGSAAGVQIPNLSCYDSLSFDFRVYYNDISSLGIYFGDTNIFQAVPTLRKWKGTDIYSDNGNELSLTRDGVDGYVYWPLSKYFSNGAHQYAELSNCFISEIVWGTKKSVYLMTPLSSSFTSSMSVPTSYTSPGYEVESSLKYGWMSFSSSVPSLYSSVEHSTVNVTVSEYTSNSSINPSYYRTKGIINHYAEKEYRWSPSQYVLADFSYDSYKNQWVSMRITISGGKLYYFVNGDLVGSGNFTKPTADKFYIKSSGTVYLDELRVTTGSLSSTSTYNPSSAPYDTNKVLALPDDLTANTIYVQHNTPVSTCRIGGVRPSNPATGFLYIPLYDDRTGAQPQLYDGSNWINVTAMVHNGDTTVNVLGYQFFPVGDSPDINVDAKPERPERPSGPTDPEACTHDWEETSRTDPTCILAGSVSYTCSKCKKTKTEALSKLGHTWEVKQSVQTSYDESGEIITQGFTIYRCSTCGEEYKTENATGPPGSGEWGSGSEIADGVLDKFPSFVNMVLSMFQQLPKLFEGFVAFLAEVFAYVPDDINLVLTFGVAAVVLIGIIKAVRG